MNVLLTSAGRRVELVEMFREQCHGQVVAADMDATAPALYVADQAARLPNVAQPHYRERLFEICARYEIGLVVPTIDTELPVLAAVAAELMSEQGVRVAISSPEAVGVALDKLRTGAALEKVCIRTVPTYPWVDGEPPTDFPLVVKPRAGAAGIGVRRIEHASLWTPPPGPGWIVQPFIDGYEVTIDVIASETGQLAALGARRRLKVRGGEVERALTVDPHPYVGHARQIAMAIGLSGPFNFQVFQVGDKEESSVCDLNPRFGGGSPLSERAGASLAAIVCAWGSTGEWPTQTEFARPGVLMARFDQSVFLDADKLAW